MNILICADNNYIERAKDMLLSIKFNNTNDLNIYFLYDNLDIDKLNNLYDFVTNVINAKFNPIKFSYSGVNFPINIDYISSITYYRLFFPFMINEKIDRILYLDCDIVCTGDISELYNMEFEDNVIIGCENMVTKKDERINIDSNKRLGLPIDNPYINAGVLLINVNKYKDIVSDYDIIHLIYDNKDILTFQDQDLINKLFYGKIKIVDSKFNYQINGVDYGLERNDHVLVHYSESDKPWNDDYVLINKLKPYYDFLCQKGDLETLEKLIKKHTDNYRDFLLRFYCKWNIW